MKVTDLQAYLLSSPLAEPLLVQTAAWGIRIRKQDCLLVRVKTDLGLAGFSAGPASANLAQLINRNLKSAVVNIDPVKIDPLRRKVFERRPDFPGLAQAFGLVEAALMDLKGKIERCPLSELLGGRVRDTVPLTACAGLYLPPEPCALEAEAITAMGFSSYQLTVGLGPSSDAQVVSLVRSKIPCTCRIIVDARAWWQMGSAVYPSQPFSARAEAVAGYKPLWLSEPVHFDETTTDAGGSVRGSIVVAGGDNQLNPEKLRTLTENAAFDVARLNVPLLGGLRACRELMEWFADCGKQCVLTGGTTPLDLLAFAQVAAGFSENVCLGLDWPCFSSSERPGMFSFSLGDELLKQPVHPENGTLRLPNVPGVGSDVNENVIQCYPWRSGASWVRS